MTRRTNTINYPVAKAVVLHVSDSSSEEGRVALQEHVGQKTFEQRAREVMLAYGFTPRQIARAETQGGSRLARMLKQALGSLRKPLDDNQEVVANMGVWLNQATRRTHWRSLEAGMLALFVPMTLHPAIQQNAPN